MRRLARYPADNLKSYEAAAADWDAKKTSKPFKNYMSKEVYDQVANRIRAEAAQLDSKIGIYEWPRSKVGYASFLDNVHILTTLPYLLKKTYGPGKS